MRVVALVCLTVAVVFGQSAGAWLDTPPRQWNRAGGPTPRAPRVDRDEIPKMCYANRPVPKTAEERAVARVGWMLFATQQDGHGVVLVRAAANFDGMCRPDAYQDFVFVGGKFAGTLSPQPMNARSDGSSSTVSFPQAGRITAQFSRYVSAVGTS